MLIRCHGSRASAVCPRQTSASAPTACWQARIERLAILHQIAIGGVGPVPFEHREFRVVGGAALAVAEDMGELPDARHPGDDELLHREFGRGMQVTLGSPTHNAGRAARF